MQAQPGAAETLTGYYTKAFGFDVPLWKQYLNSGRRSSRAISAQHHGLPDRGLDADLRRAPYTLALLVPAILLSFWAGNKVGALAARRKGLDNGVLPVLRADGDPADVARNRPRVALRDDPGRLPCLRRYGLGLQPEWSLKFAGSFLYHWFLPFIALFLVAFGGWAIGMRNLIIYELEADYSQYLAALGAPTKLVRRYAYRNALLPQITGLALALGAVVAGAIVVEIVFGYPGSAR